MIQVNYGVVQNCPRLYESFHPQVPNLYDIQSRLSYVSCTRQLEELKASNYCEYIRPPIDKYQTLQFGAFDEIKEVGYQHGKTYFSGMLKGGRTVESIYQLSCHSSSECWKNNKSSLNASPASFTDLAQVVCAVKKPTANNVIEGEGALCECNAGGGLEYQGGEVSPRCTEVSLTQHSWIRTSYMLCADSMIDGNK